ncbi:hypothetical protein GQ43DRAFT_470393 [Delitschia confertaspora ATCC 74209]|uniref:Protein kinase domain-containing protein n=1 Tax=Delitschia confertaspora ATCC 74209 TaxID=1513339 RepID=A0A9P4JTH7_9PLEO|nr:hypothetical protein GQ43DRAFT_470393 [Delitschia confertaspora ATCC 74209]
MYARPHLSAHLGGDDNFAQARPLLSREEIDNHLSVCIPREPPRQYVDESVFLEIKGWLSRHPDAIVQRWSDNPRVYTLLRMLGYDIDSQTFIDFDNENIGDVWLPLSSRYLHNFSDFDRLAERFSRMQAHVLSKPEDMGEFQLLNKMSDHRYIPFGKSHFEEGEPLGKGGSAEVSRVRHIVSGKEFARKRIVRGQTIAIQKKQLREFEREVSILKRLRHKHIIRFVASYTDFESFCLILSPVAKDVLKSMLERQSREDPLSSEDCAILRRSFGCLTTALAYVHKQNVRHKDIKPGNILISAGTVYLCDFGISLDWKNEDHSTTKGDVVKYTEKYCAPEVADKDQRNSASDIWSLGSVFLELVTVIQGYPLEEMNRYLSQGSSSVAYRGFWSSPNVVEHWLSKIKAESRGTDDEITPDWVTLMMKENPKDRPTALEVVNTIVKQSAGLRKFDLFIGPCCGPVDIITPFQSTVDTLMQASRIDSKNPTLSVHNDQCLPKVPTSPQMNVGVEDISPCTESADPPASLDSQPIRPGSIKSDSGFKTAESPDIPSFGPMAVPPAATFPLKCSCFARENEILIFNEPYLSLPSGPPASNPQKCESSENRIQIYETRPVDPNISQGDGLLDQTMPKIWWVTRRLVISHLQVWLPLADLFFTITGSEVTLRWSDCNQISEKSVNYSLHYDWEYVADNPNQSLDLSFNETADAQRFVDCVRFPAQNGVTVRNERKIDLSEIQEVRVYDVGRRSREGKMLDYPIFVVTNRTKSNTQSSKLYIQWSEIDLKMDIKDLSYDSAQSDDCSLELTIKKIATPTYLSDVRGAPSQDFAEVAQFKEAHQEKSSLIFKFPMEMKSSLTHPPIGQYLILFIRPSLTVCLTGWTLRYFVFVDKLSRNRRFLITKKYGRAAVMLWEKKVDSTSVTQHQAQLTFRMNEKSEEGRWLSGTINETTYLTTSASTDTTITLSNKRRGKLLKITTMEASSGVSPSIDVGHPRNVSNAGSDPFELVLKFEEKQYRRDFLTIVEVLADEFKKRSMDHSIPTGIRRVANVR